MVEFKRSPLIMMGSKYRSLEHILEVMPTGMNTWVDVFGGSGVVTLNVPQHNLEVFNDIHSGVASFFYAVQFFPTKLIDLIQQFPHSRELFEQFMNDYTKFQDPVVRGAMWYYIVRSSFAGRGDKFGRELKGRNIIAKKLRDPKSLEYFRDLKTRFCTTRMTVENRHWRDILKDYDTPDTLFYLDPPYVDSNCYGYKMSRPEHKEMCETIFNLKGFVMLSGYDNDIYAKYPWDEIYRFKVHTVCTQQVDLIRGQDTRDEFLWIKENF